jgi:hypothetical protein
VPGAPSHADALGLACRSALLALAAGLTHRGARRHEEVAQRLVPVLNGVSAVLVAMPLVTMLSAVGSTPPAQKTQAPSAPTATGTARPGPARPDIYYIVLDGFGASEQLRRGPFVYLDGHSYLLTHTKDEYRSGYASQVRFLASELLGVVDGILAASADPPVIVIQGDHGPGVGFHHEQLERSDVIERALILNAYHLPGEAEGALRPDITPVNSFRLILRHYLGEDLPPLPDRTFYNRESQPYDYRDVTINVQRYIRARRASEPQP